MLDWKRRNTCDNWFFNKTYVKCNQKQCKMNETTNEQKLMCHRCSHKWNIHFNLGKIPTCTSGHKKCTRQKFTYFFPINLFHFFCFKFLIFVSILSYSVIFYGLCYQVSLIYITPIIEAITNISHHIPFFVLLSMFLLLWTSKNEYPKITSKAAPDIPTIILSLEM